MTKVTMTVNGKSVSAETEGRTLLSSYLREGLGLTGTHIGCDTSQCGACVVHIDGVAVKSCSVFAQDVAGSKVTTIEGMANGDKLHVLQRKFLEHAALQCGICTPGMLIAAKTLLDHNPNPTEEQTRYWLAGNLCRCTGYNPIIEAVLDAAKELRGA